MYELHIYTMGDRGYAAEVRRILDPSGRLFTSVISAVIFHAASMHPPPALTPSLFHSKTAPRVQPNIWTLPWSTITS